MKVIQRVPQPLYEFSDLHDRPIECVVYNYELVRVTISPETQFQIDKLGRTRNKGGIKQHLVKWRGYDKILNAWVKATDIKKI